MSFCTKPTSPARSAVVMPTPATTAIVVGDIANRTFVLAMRKIPDVTMVAAWIRADTGVGPAIASGSQTPSGICALLPVQPRNRRSVISVAISVERTVCAPELIALYSSVPKLRNRRNIASRTPKSPIRLTTNAFIAASPVQVMLVPSNFLSYQKPINRYEARPTPSQPRKVRSMLLASTKFNIMNTNRLR